jgi:hypothetical protein
MGPHIGRIHCQQFLDLPEHLDLESERHRYPSEYLVVGTVQGPAVMPFPYGLPRPEIRRQITPRAASAESPCDSFQDQPVVTEPVASLTYIRRH